MDFSFFPELYKKSINNLRVDMLYELRLRSGYPVILNYGLKRYYLGFNGATLLRADAIVCSIDDINFVINELTEKSIYAFSDKIKQGFLTNNEGVRVGLSGECVFENDKIITIKNVTSLNIRIPHEIENCSKDLIKYVYNKDEIFNTLIISPPFKGKTTILKDIIKKFNTLFNKPILVIDERGEFSTSGGENVDIIKYCNKQYAFEYGVRVLSPEIIITDELSSISDWNCVLNASNSGVKVIASCHGYNLTDVINKEYFKKNVFERYIAIKNGNEFGKICGVYNKEFEKI